MPPRNPLSRAVHAAARGARGMVEQVARTLIRPFGLAVGRSILFERGSRLTFPRALEHVKRLGLDPRTVIDVGVAAGTWPLYEAFPNARIVLIEPVAEARAQLEVIASRYPHVEYVIAALSSRCGPVVLNVHRDMERSSTRWESDFHPDDVTKKEVTGLTLDELRRERRLEGPHLLKVDVQGAELDVLDGARETLEGTEYVILECCFFDFFAGGPLLADVVTYMNERGFVPYDILSIHYRPLDGALSTADVAFVKEASGLRRTHRFQWTPLR